MHISFGYGFLLEEKLLSRRVNVLSWNVLNSAWFAAADFRADPSAFGYVWFMIPCLFLFSLFFFSFEAVIKFRGIGKGVDPVDRRVPGVIFSFHSAWLHFISLRCWEFFSFWLASFIFLFSLVRCFSLIELGAFFLHSIHFFLITLLQTF